MSVAANIRNLAGQKAGYPTGQLQAFNDGDGFFTPGRLVGYAAMEGQAGWGAEIPEMLRNDEWNYPPSPPTRFSADEAAARERTRELAALDFRGEPTNTSCP